MEARSKVVIFLVQGMLFFFLGKLSARSLDEIREAIRKSNLKWKAGSTSVWGLSDEEKKALCGLKIPEEAPQAKEIYYEKLTEPPPHFDWRDYEGHNWMTPVKNQGACGSCWAFAIVGVMEAAIKIRFNAPESDIDLSEQDLVNCVCYGCNGGDITCSANYLMNHGIPDEECVTYVQTELNCEDRCSDWQERTRKIEDWWRVPSDIEQIKLAIMEGPLYVAMNVYDDFYAYRGGVYSPSPGAHYVGGHAVVMLGWDDIDSCWICKNSWGTGWGEEGWFKIRWGVCGIESWVWGLLPAPTNYPKIDYVSYRVKDEEGDGDGVLNPGETVELIVTLENEGGWADAYNIETSLSLSNNVPWADILVENSFFPDIHSGERADNSSSPFVVAVRDSVTPQSIPMELEISANGIGQLPYYTRHISFSLKISFDQWGWPVDGIGNVSSSPLPIDIDGDSALEVIAGTNSGDLFLLRHTGENAEGFPLSLGESLLSSQSVGDIDDDGELEIVVTGNHSPAYIIEKNGSIQRQMEFSGVTFSTPSIADLDGDGELEIVLGTLFGDVYVFNHEGTNYSDAFPFSLGTGERIKADVALGDITGDGRREIIVGTTSGHLYAISCEGEILEGWPVELEGGVYEAPAIADLDGSGPKVISGTNSGYLYGFDSSGNEWLQVFVGEKITSSPSFADIDGDGDLEIFFGTESGKIYGFHHSGEVVEGWPYQASSEILSSPCFSDVNNDGFPEVITCSSDGFVYCIRRDGESFYPFPVEVANSILSSPAVIDMDGDGDLEVVGGYSQGIFAVDIKREGGEGAYWNMYGGSPWRTNCYADVIKTSVGEKRAEGLSFRLYQSYPNPCRGRMKIRYFLPNETMVTFKVFDRCGRLVRRIEKGREKEGLHELIWDLRNERGRKIPSGVYFFILEAGGLTKSKKFAILN